MVVGGTVPETVKGDERLVETHRRGVLTAAPNKGNHTLELPDTKTLHILKRIGGAGVVLLGLGKEAQQRNEGIRRRQRRGLHLLAGELRGLRGVQPRASSVELARLREHRLVFGFLLGVVLNLEALAGHAQRATKQRVDKSTSWATGAEIGGVAHRRGQLEVVETLLARERERAARLGEHGSQMTLDHFIQFTDIAGTRRRGSQIKVSLTLAALLETRRKGLSLGFVVLAPLLGLRGHLFIAHGGVLQKR